MTPEFRVEARKLARARVDQREILKILYEETSAALHEEELAKPLAFKTLKLAEEDFNQLCDHLLDGGGTIDKFGLGRKLVQDLLDRNQSVNFLANLIHYVKSGLKLDGIVLSNGDGIQINGVSPSTKENLKKEDEGGIKNVEF